MFIDANTIPENLILECDICIVGGGATGITIAQEFVNSKVELCILESGGFEFDDKTQSLYEGENIGKEYFPLHSTRLRYFGGSTNHWGGMGGPLTKIDFDTREWIPMSGWPFDLNHLTSYYRRANKICQIAPPTFSIKELETLVGSPSLPINAKIFSDYVVRYSPPTRFGKRYKKTLNEATNVRVILNANGLKFATNESASKINNIKFATVEKKIGFVKAKIYVLASGGIENPRILLLSSVDPKYALGNKNDLVGRFFMEHPHMKCGKFVPRSSSLDINLYNSELLRRGDGIRSNAAIMPSFVSQQKYALSNGLFLLEPKFDDDQNPLSEKLDKFTEEVGRYIRKSGMIEYPTFLKYFKSDLPLNSATITSMWEQVPNFESRVKLSTDKDILGQFKVELNWALSKIDTYSIERSLELLALEIGKAELGRIRIDLSPYPGWPGGHHHMGTTRMNVNPKFGVVNENCRIHEISNLYIAGSSVFPTVGAINPTLTIVALAIRLADYLKEKMDG